MAAFKDDKALANLAEKLEIHANPITQGKTHRGRRDVSVTAPIVYVYTDYPNKCPAEKTGNIRSVVAIALLFVSMAHILL